MRCVDFTQGMSFELVSIRYADIDIRFFYKHELLAKYDWYWRVEPDIKYFCDIT